MSFRLGAIGTGLERFARRCWRKHRHATEGAASAAMRSLLRRGLATDESRLHVYRCPDCGGWHTGHAGRP